MSRASKKAKSSQVRSLLVIDNTPIRKKSITSVQKWFKKIEETEQSAKKYQETDLRLYTDWCNLTLNPLIEEIDQSRREFIKLAEFHNLMVVVSNEKKIPMPAAYLFLQEEEAQYQNGNDQVRAQIDARRAKRAKILEKEQQQDSSQNECNCEFCRSQRAEFADDENPPETPFDVFEEVLNTFKKEDELIQKDREKFKSQIAYYERLSDKKLTKIMRQFEEGYQFLFEAVAILIQCSRTDLLRRIWSLAPASLKKVINQKAKVDFKMTIEEVMEDSDERDQMRDEALGFDEFDPSEDDFDDDFVRGSNIQHKKKTEELKEDDQIRIKSLFRKIVRRIHPDHLKLGDSQNLKAWFDQLWKKVAEAHEQNDLEKLTQLHYKIVVALKDYDELAVSELVTTAKLLEKEYATLSQEYSELRNSPAWNFSQLKDYRKLKKEQSKPYLQQLKRLNQELAEIKEQRAEIERIAELIKEGKIKMGQRRSRRRKASTRPASGRRRSNQDNFGQMNFSFDSI